MIIKEFPVPEQIQNELMTRRTVNNDKAEKVALLMNDMRVLSNKINVLESEREVNNDNIVQLIRDSIPELKLKPFTMNFDTMTATTKEI